MLSNHGAREDSWTARRSIKSILKEINPEYSLEGLMLKLKLQYFGNLMQRADSLEKTLMLGKIKGRRSGQQRMRGWDGITDSRSLSKLRETVKDRGVWHAAVNGVARNQTQLSNWTTWKWFCRKEGLFYTPTRELTSLRGPEAFQSSHKSKPLNLPFVCTHEKMNWDTVKVLGLSEPQLQ